MDAGGYEGLSADEREALDRALAAARLVRPQGSASAEGGPSEAAATGSTPSSPPALAAAADSPPTTRPPESPSPAVNGFTRRHRIAGSVVALAAAAALGATLAIATGAARPSAAPSAGTTPSAAAASAGAGDSAGSTDSAGSGDTDAVQPPSVLSQALDRVQVPTDALPEALRGAVDPPSSRLLYDDDPSKGTTGHRWRLWVGAGAGLSQLCFVSTYDDVTDVVSCVPRDRALVDRIIVSQTTPDGTFEALDVRGAIAVQVR